VSRKFIAIASCVMAISAGAAAAADSALPTLTSMSIQVQPQIGVSSAGKMLSLDVRCEGISGVGTKAPVSVLGAPEGTNISVAPVTDQYALVSLVFPATTANGRYALTVTVGAPEPLVKQNVEVRIGE